MIGKIGNIAVINSTLNSYSQVFFSDHRIFAAMLLVVTFLDPLVGLSGLMAVVVSNGVAYMMGFNKPNIIKGFYGFNSLLVGLGLGVFYNFSFEFFLVLIFVALLTTFITIALEGVIGKYGLPYLSIPFLFGIWLVTLAARNYTLLEVSDRGVYALNEMYSIGGLPLVNLYDWFNQLNLHESIIIYFRSLGAIFFQYHMFPGLIIAIGLLLYSRIAFSLSLLGFFSAYLFYNLVGADITELSYAYIGFNYILTAIAIGGFFIIPSTYSYVWAVLLTPLISIILTAFHTLFAPFQLSIYSLPFNVIVLVFLYVLKFRETRFKQPELIIYQQFSPEKNLYNQKNKSNRFGDNIPVRLSLPFWGEWKVTQGHSGKITHKDNWKHAWDFEIVDDKDLSCRDEGLAVTDYFCYDKPVIAPAEGWIDRILDGIDDNAIGTVNLKQNWGNTVVIRHGEKLYSALSHLKKGSIKFRKGDYVKKGDVIAHCGNSGRSPVPHLHYQLQTTPQIGSGTLDYPIGNYLLKGNNCIDLKSLDRPKPDELVCNIEVDQVIKKAFNFTPGHYLKLNVDKAQIFGAEEQFWEITTDVFNYTNIHCKETGAKAYFRNDEDMFYFTHFQGPKNCILYHFYLAAFKVIFGKYNNLEVHDTFPLNIMSHGYRRVLQDFVAPFYLFLRNDYFLKISGNADLLGNGNRMLESQCKVHSGGKLTKIMEFRISIKNQAIDFFTIQLPGKEAIQITCTKD